MEGKPKYKPSDMPLYYKAPVCSETLFSLRQTKEDMKQIEQAIQEEINSLYEKYKEIDFKINFEGYKTIGNNHVIVRITASI